MPRVRLQQPLARITGGDGVVHAEGSTVGEVIEFLEARFGDLRAEISDDKGNLHRHIIISVNEEDIRFLSDFDTPVGEGDEIAIVPALSGG